MELYFSITSGIHTAQLLLVDIFFPSKVTYSLEIILSESLLIPEPLNNAGKIIEWNGILSFPWT